MVEQGAVTDRELLEAGLRLALELIDSLRLLSQRRGLTEREIDEQDALCHWARAVGKQLNAH